MKTPRKKLSIPVTRKFLDKHSQLKEAVVMAAKGWGSSCGHIREHKELIRTIANLLAYEQKHKWEPIEKW